jgi:hypothetical protein
MNTLEMYCHLGSFSGGIRMHDLQRHVLIVAVAGVFVLSQSTQSPTAQAGESGGTGSALGPAYFYCSSEPGQPVVYFTDFFVAESGRSTTTAHNQNQSVPEPVIKMQNDFLAFLKRKYAFKSNSNYPTGCPSFGNGAAGLSLAQASKKSLESRYAQAKNKIVETGWKYKP